MDWGVNMDEGFHISGIAKKRIKRPRDVSQWAKLIVDIAIGKVENHAPTPEEEGKELAAVVRGKHGPYKGVAPTNDEVSHATLQSEMLQGRKVGWD